MKNFRHIALSALVTIGAFGSVIYTGCKDKCGSVTCENGGTCEENVCVCPTGYSGSSCTTTWTTEYVGTYNCTQKCTPAAAGGSWQSPVVVSVNNPGYTVTIENFAGTSSLNIDATVDSIGNIVIAEPSGTYGISARGTYATSSQYPNGFITLTYTTSSADGTGYYQCTMTMVKE